MKDTPTFVIKRDTKRPSGIQPLADLDPGLSWISELHRLWKVPVSRRAIGAQMKLTA